MRLRSPWPAPFAPPGPGLHLTFASFLLVGFVFLSVDASRCFIGQERNPTTNGLMWALPYKEPCWCTYEGPELGGVSMIQGPLLHRPFDVPYLDAPSKLPEIREKLECPIYVCAQEEALGMEDERIAAGSITASSHYDNRKDHSPERARLNTQDVAAAWCNQNDDHAPWIQVKFSEEVYVTGLITQARGNDSSNNGHQRVTRYNVSYRSDDESWNTLTDVHGVPKEFAGNSEGMGYDETVTSIFGKVLRTKFLRIQPTAWHKHCSMRFEVLGCYEPTVLNTT